MANQTIVEPSNRTLADISGPTATLVIAGDDALLAHREANRATTEANRAAAWAEGTLPGGAGTKSAKEHATDASLSASVAVTAAGPNYPSTTAGLAATINGQAFAVDEVTTIAVYRRDGPSTATFLRRYPKDITASTGAELVGHNDGAGGSLWTTIAGFIAHLRSSVGSAIVGFIAAGTGATARTVQAKARDVISSEDYATLEQALAYASANDLELRLKDGEEYTLSSDVTLTAGLRMRGRAKIKMGANINGIVVNPSRTVSTAVSAITNTRFPAGTGIEQSAVLTVASATGFAVNDVCILYSQDAYPFNASAKKAELVKINSISGTTIYLAGNLIDTYSSGVTLVKLNPAVVDIDGPEFTFDGDPLVPTSKTRFAAITLVGCVAPRVRATFHDDIADGLRLYSCWMPDVDVRAYNLRNNVANSLFGYGVASYGACARGMVRIIADNVRHAYTDGVWVSVDPINFGRATDMTVYDSIATNCSFASFDTHPGARNTRFVNCGAVYNVTNADQPSSTNAYAFQDRAVHSKFINCWSRGSRVPFYFGSVLENHGEINTTEVIGGYFEREGTTTSNVFNALPSKTTADVCTINIRGAVLDGYTPNQSAQSSTILNWHGVEFISNGTYGYAAVNNTGGMRFFNCTFREFSILRFGQNNNYELYGCRRINSGSAIETMVLGVGSICTIDDYYAEAASYGSGRIIQAGQGSDAGTVTLNLGSVRAKGFTSANAVVTNGTATLTLNNMLLTERAARRGTTANRPTLNAADIGYLYLDTTLDADGKPIWWTGTAWVDATGATV